MNFSHGTTTQSSSQTSIIVFSITEKPSQDEESKHDAWTGGDVETIEMLILSSPITSLS